MDNPIEKFEELLGNIRSQGVRDDRERFLEIVEELYKVKDYLQKHARINEGPKTSVEELVPSINIPRHKRKAAQQVYSRDKTQIEFEWDFLTRGYSITQAEAAIFWMDFRLADTVHRIKKQDWYAASDKRIVSEDLETSVGKTIAQYYLTEKGSETLV